MKLSLIPNKFEIVYINPFFTTSFIPNKFLVVYINPFFTTSFSSSLDYVKNKIHANAANSNKLVPKCFWQDNIACKKTKYKSIKTMILPEFPGFNETICGQ